MRLKLALKVFFLLIIFKSYSNTDKYRIILLDDPSSTITIGWNQISGIDSKVYYGTVDHGENYMLYANFKTVDRVVDFRGMNNQFARLQNLLPNTNYYFVIKDSENTSKRLWFRTAPGDNSRLSFIAGGDSRNNRTPRQNANTLVSKLKPHAVLFGGDMTDDDTTTEWKNWFDDWQLTISSDGRMIPIIPARGNHEDPDVIYKLFDTSDENSYYALTFGDNLIRTYTLNSEISVLGDQLTWLTSDLSTATNIIWKTAQYHKPMRPHTAGKSEGNSEYEAWAQLFYDNNVRLVVDCDSHMAKTTWPIKPSAASGNEEGFIIDQNKGTVYTGEGSWGAPLRPNNDSKSWTRNSGSFNQFKLIYVDENKIELRTIRVNNADDVAELSNENPFEIPENLDIFSPETGAVVTISNKIDNNCSLVGTLCDDNNVATVNDEEDGFCNCVGLNSTDLEAVTFAVSSSSDDAEEIVSTGVVDLTSSDLEFIYDGQDQVVGIRFNNVTLPEGATLYRAYIQFEADETDAEQDPTNLVIYGELAEASSTFEEVANNVSSRIQTATSVSWNEVALWEEIGEKNIKQRSPYITTIVNEIINQTGWVSGNAITFIFSGKGKRVAEAIDGTSAPELKLFYQQPCLSEGTSCDDGNSDTYFDAEDGFCNCAGIEKEGTLNYQIAASIDDVEQAETGGVIYTNSSDLELVYDTFADQFNQNIGLRFNKITLPKNALITNAYLQFTSDETDDEETNLVISGEKVANSLVFEEVDFNVTLRPKTVASVSWSQIPSWEEKGEILEAQKTPNIKTIVQEIVNLEAWEYLNSMTFFINGTGKRVAESFDGDQDAAPKLIIEYNVENVLSTETNNAAQGFLNMYPNPVRGFLNVHSKEIVKNVKFYSLIGKEVLNVSLNVTKARIRIADLKSGLYIVKVILKDATEKSFKIQVK
jgi:hypothetical protein